MGKKYIFLITIILHNSDYYTSPVSVQDGGTGLSTIGTANYVLASNSTATVLTYRPSASVQKVSSSTSAAITCNVAIPADAVSIPTNTQGVEVLTVSITPTSASSILEIEFSTFGYTDLHAVTAALFQDSTVNALAAVCLGWPGGVGGSINGVLRYRMTAGTTSSTTFKIRVGPVANNFYINGSFNGVDSTYLTVEEFLV